MVRKLEVKDIKILLPYAIEYYEKIRAIEHIARLYEVDYLLKIALKRGNNKGEYTDYKFLDRKLEEYDLKINGIPYRSELTDEGKTDYVAMNYNKQLEKDEYTKKLYEMTGLKSYKENRTSDDGEYKYKFLSNRAERVFNCGKRWFHDEWTNQGYRETQAITHCYDLMCPQCQELKARARVTRYMPHLEKISEEFDLYHATLTQPNNSAEELPKMIKRMQKAFHALTEYFSGAKSIKGLDLSCYGYEGAIRNIEVTFKLMLRQRGEEYHPHIHAILALMQDLELPEIYANKYSYSAQNGKTVFNELEILIQKLWYLLMEDKVITLKAINELPLGYSCTCKKIERCPETNKLKGAYETFKYTTKAFTSDSESTLIRLDQFQVLREALAGERLLEGYGIFRGFQEEIDFTSDDIADTIYEELRDRLNSVEVAKSTASSFYEVFDDMCQDKPRFAYFSKKQFLTLYQADPDYFKTLTPNNYNELITRLEIRRGVLSDLHKTDRQISRLTWQIDQDKKTLWVDKDSYSIEKDKCIKQNTKALKFHQEWMNDVARTHPDIYKTFQHRKGILELDLERKSPDIETRKYDAPSFYVTQDGERVELGSEPDWMK